MHHGSFILESGIIMIMDTQAKLTAQHTAAQLGWLQKALWLISGMPNRPALLTKIS